MFNIRWLDPGKVISCCLQIDSLKIGWDANAAQNALIHCPTSQIPWVQPLLPTIELQLSWGKLQKKPATRWFDESFAPIPRSDKRFARQQHFHLPPHFHMASMCLGIVHHLSGPVVSINTQSPVWKTKAPVGYHSSLHQHHHQDSEEDSYLAIFWWYTNRSIT